MGGGVNQQQNTASSGTDKKWLILATNHGDDD